MESGAASLSSQFRTLAQDFRGTDAAGGYQRVIDLAAYGGKLCRKAHNAGLLDLTRYKRLVALLAERASKNTCQQDDLESLIRDLLVEEYGEISAEPLDALNELLDQRLDERKMWPSRDSAHMWAGTWMSIVSDLSTDHPDELPCNLFVTTNSYDWAFRGRFRGEALRNAKTEWRSLAQNYAMVADWLAEHLQAGDPAGDLPGALAAGSASAGAAGQDGDSGKTPLIEVLGQVKPDPTRAAYGVDCRCVNWYGALYTFTGIQAACVKVLIEHYKNGVPEVGEQAILTNEWVSSAQTRLLQVFDKGRHDAWGTMIVPGATKGTFRLNKPQ